MKIIGKAECVHCERPIENLGTATAAVWLHSEGDAKGRMECERSAKATPPSAVRAALRARLIKDRATSERLHEAKAQDKEVAGPRWPHAGPNGGRCSFCGVRIDMVSRGRTCADATKHFADEMVKDVKR